MKRASKKLRAEMKLKRQQLHDEVAAAIIPIEMQTPKMKRLAKIAINKAGQLDGAFKKIDNLTEDDIAKIRPKLKSAPFELRRILKNAIKKLPHDPGGRKTVLSEEQRRKVAPEIAALILKGYEPKTAKEIVALRHGVSASTIKRVWTQRSKPAKDA